MKEVNKVQNNSSVVTVVGGGLAGCEAAYQLAKAGFEVYLYDMKPTKKSPAHHANTLCEIVCSNSLKSNLLSTASGVLKKELEILDSIVLKTAQACAVPAGSALAVDRELFTQKMDKIIKNNPKIHFFNKEIAEIPQGDVIIATGPLTSNVLAQTLHAYLGETPLSFYDASAPIVTEESLLPAHYFTTDRYQKGESDYINCPLTKEEYENFVQELTHAQRVQLHAFETADVFEGCMPIEIMADRGTESLRFGPMRPVGLIDPKTNKRPYAVLQLRKEHATGGCYNLVGCQTNLTFPEQKRVFSLIPALKQAEFVKYGVMHRNTFICAPKVLQNDFSLKKNPSIFIAGQLSGVEGYMESTMSGLIAALGMVAHKKNLPWKPISEYTITGALISYITKASQENFQPMNANFGILPALENAQKNKNERKLQYAERAIRAMQQWREEQTWL